MYLSLEDLRRSAVGQNVDQQRDWEGLQSVGARERAGLFILSELSSEKLDLPAVLVEILSNIFIVCLLLVQLIFPPLIF